jgi:hypothetical protein
MFIALSKFYATHRNYEILSKSLVPIGQLTFIKTMRESMSFVTQATLEELTFLH